MQKKKRFFGVPFSRFLTLFEVRVILILWICSGPSSAPNCFAGFNAYAIVSLLPFPEKQIPIKKRLISHHLSSIQKHHHHITVEIKQTQEALLDTLSWAWRLEVGAAGLFSSFSENRKEVEFDATLSYKRVRFNGLFNPAQMQIFNGWIFLFSFFFFKMI